MIVRKQKLANYLVFVGPEWRNHGKREKRKQDIAMLLHLDSAYNCFRFLQYFHETPPGSRYGFSGRMHRTVAIPSKAALICT